MKTDECIKMYQTTDVNEVNEYLAKGYRVIKVLSTRTNDSTGEVILPTYVMGLKWMNILQNGFMNKLWS